MIKLKILGGVVGLLSICNFAFGQVNPNPSSYTGSSHLLALSGAPIRLAVYNTKKCLEESKMGKSEQANLEKMKEQMMNVLQEKGKTYQEIENKLNDEDYMDSISSEAEAELKRKRRQLRDEGMELQSQYAETFQYARLKSIDKLGEVVNKASSMVAQENGLHLILSDEASSYVDSSLDITDRIIAKMNLLFEQEQKENKTNK